MVGWGLEQSRGGIISFSNLQCREAGEEAAALVMSESEWKAGIQGEQLDLVERESAEEPFSTPL